MDQFKALVIDQVDDKISAEIKEIDETQLPEGDVTVRVGATIGEAPRTKARVAPVAR